LGLLIEDTLSVASVSFFYVVDWLPPWFGAVGQYATVFASELAGDGRHVYLIGLTRGTRSETVDPVGPGILETIKIPAVAYDKSRLTVRLAWTLHTNARLLWEVIRRPESRGADLLFTGSPPFFLYFAILARFVRRLRLIYRITDFYPEVIIADRGKRSFSLALLQRLTWFMRRRVDMFEILGEDQRQILLQNGIPSERIRLRRDPSPVAFSGRELPLPRPKQLNGLAVLLYSGNYGVPHDVDTVVEGFIEHHRAGSGGTGLWLNAVGRNADRVEALLRSAGVPCARSTTVPLDQLPALLRSADAHLVTLRSAFSGIVLPSKVYACISSGRPIIYVGPKSSDVHLLCSSQPPDAYTQIEPRDIVSFVTALERLAISSRPIAQC
jgi:hypothetical protein